MGQQRAWYDDFGSLISRPLNFFPAPDSTPEERLNALVRLIIYVTTAVILYNGAVQYVYLGLAGILVISAGHYVKSKDTAAKTTKSARKPTKDNPYQNVLAGETPVVSSYTNPEDVDENGWMGEHGAVADESRSHVRSPFITLPNAGGVPDTQKFANFLRS